MQKVVNYLLNELMRELVSGCTINTECCVLYSVEAWGNFDEMGRLQRKEVGNYFIWNIIDVTRNIFSDWRKDPI